MRRSWRTRVCSAMKGSIFFMFCIVVTITGNNIFVLKVLRLVLRWLALVRTVTRILDIVACFAKLNNGRITTKRIDESLSESVQQISRTAGLFTVFRWPGHGSLLRLVWILNTYSKYYLFRIHFNIIPPSTFRSSNWSFPLRYLYQSSVCMSYFSHVFYLSRPSHISSFFLNYTWRRL